jgi:hypothetical protein
MTRRCLRCGQNGVRNQARAGRTVSYRTLPAFPLPADFPLPTCRYCHAEYPDAETLAALDKVLVLPYVRELQRRTRYAVGEVCACISQRRLELRLGLSQGYLSRLCAGSGRPSAPLVALLMLLALDPPARLAELERISTEPIPVPDAWSE